MAAIIGLSDEVARSMCADISATAGNDAVLQAVNFNAPGQVVIAGDAMLIELGMSKAKELGAKLTKQLPISVPCHSDRLRDAAAELSASLEATPMRAPKIPVIHNIDAQPRLEVEEIRRAMAVQLYSPVLWTDCIQRLASEGTSLLIECGPGRVLSGLSRRINRSLTGASLHDSASVDHALELATTL
jgi:[acyl-carrier-protein] S-malonyltransferase